MCSLSFALARLSQMQYLVVKGCHFFKVIRKKINTHFPQILCMELHNLMKKQTILVFVSILSTITLGILAIINVNMVFQAGWDTIVNMICVWMMLNTSKRYWICCRKYGLCICCYWKVNQIGM